MKPYILKETNWATIKGSQYDIALLPWGATEPHNYHLPYGTDTLETEKIVADAAKIAWEAGCKVMALPPIPFGAQNPGQVELPFCIPMNPSTQLKVLHDITKALHRQGIKKLIIMNGHGGNNFKPIIRELQLEFNDMFLGLAEWFKMLDNNIYFEEAGDHGGEMETSIIQYYFPELVLPLDKAGNGEPKKFKINALNKNQAWTPRRWDKVTADTGVGNPKKANPEKGKKFIQAVTKEIASFFIELSNHSPVEVYER